MTTAAQDERPAQRPAVAVVDVLAQVREELRGLAKVMEHRQYLVRKSTQDPLALDRDHIRAMQSIDYIGQNLIGLADFLKKLSAMMSRDWRVDPADAAAAVTLSELASRLRCQADRQAVKHEDSDGDCDFF